MLMAGPELISFVDFKISPVSERRSPAVLRELLFADAIPMAPSANMHLLYVLDKLSANECEDPRDRVFGLLGVVAEHGRIEVDYSLSPSDVFFKTVRKIVEIGIYDVSNRQWQRYESHLEIGEAASRLEDLANQMAVEIRPGQVFDLICRNYNKYRRSNAQ